MCRFFQKNIALTMQHRGDDRMFKYILIFLLICASICYAHDTSHEHVATDRHGKNHGGLATPYKKYLKPHTHELEVDSNGDPITHDHISAELTTDAELAALHPILDTAETGVSIGRHDGDASIDVLGVDYDWWYTPHDHTPHNQNPTFSEGASTTRSIPENTPASQNIGDPVTATDEHISNSESFEDDPMYALTYTLGGTDAALFNIVGTTSQLRTKAPLDFETKDSYEVTVTVTNTGGGTDEITVTITVTDINETVPNSPPAFADATATRSVAENTPAGIDIGSPITATDPEGDTLIYTLGGTDAASFSIVAATGQLQTKAALDFETKSTYTVTITATDTGGLTGEIAVTITVTDVDETVPNSPPVFAATTATRSVAENTPAATDIGSPITATDPDSGDTLTYTLSGRDGASFSIVATTGQLQTKAALDFETKSTYTVTITATDNRGLTDEITVTITITDVDEKTKPTTVEIVGDDSRMAPINQPIADPFVVKVKDENDNPITDVPVDFSVDPNDGQLTPESDMTDENGEAQTQLTPGNTAGTYTITANVPSISQSVSFYVTTTRPTTIEIVSGDNQRAGVNQSLANPLVVKVKDENDNVVSGVTVNFFVNPSFGQLDPESATTDTNGEAQTILTLGSAVRTYYVTASVPDISESVTFTAHFIRNRPPTISEPIEPSDFSPKPKIVVSKIMFETKGEPDKYPQWIELYNNDTFEVNLNGYEFILLASSFSIDYDLIIKPKNTVLIASHVARFSENIQPNNLHIADVPIIDMSDLSGFLIELLDSEDRRIDYVNTYDTDTYSIWEMPNGIVKSENDARTSIVRRFREGEPVEGYKQVAWVRASDTEVDNDSTFWYGHSTDIGTPGYRSSRNPKPVLLSTFIAKLHNENVVIKWTTEAELDNAGFNIYRSTTRNGQFRQVNAKLIQGAGTTGERNKYTWIDTTAKPNTVYYYRIEDVSHAGVREQLATIHMKGFITAKDKFTTKWATLKNQR